MIKNPIDQKILSIFYKVSDEDAAYIYADYLKKINDILKNSTDQFLKSKGISDEVMAKITDAQDDALLDQISPEAANLLDSDEYKNVVEQQIAEVNQVYYDKFKLNEDEQKHLDEYLLEKVNSDINTAMDTYSIYKELLSELQNSASEGNSVDSSKELPVTNDVTSTTTPSTPTISLGGQKVS